MRRPGRGGRGENVNPQIEFAEEDPAVWELFENELRARGHDPSKMDSYRSEEPE